MADAYAFGLVKVDNEKAKDYYELGAMKGNPYARHNVGCMEEDAGNMERAIKLLHTSIISNTCNPHWLLITCTYHQKQ